MPSWRGNSLKSDGAMNKQHIKAANAVKKGGNRHQSGVSARGTRPRKRPGRKGNRLVRVRVTYRTYWRGGSGERLVSERTVFENRLVDWRGNRVYPCAEEV